MKYFINKKLLIILIAFFVSIAVFAEIPSMEEMYKIMDKVFDTGNFKKDFTMKFLISFFQKYVIILLNI